MLEEILKGIFFFWKCAKYKFEFLHNLDHVCQKQLFFLKNPGFFFMPPPPDIAKVLVPCARCGTCAGRSNLLSVQIKCCDLCGCAATNYLCCAEWRVWVLCNWSRLQAETFADRNFWRQKLVPQCLCIVPIRYLCLMLYSVTSQRHKERHKKIDRHGNIACALCHCGTCAAGGGGA